MLSFSRLRISWISSRAGRAYSKFCIELDSFSTLERRPDTIGTSIALNCSTILFWVWSSLVTFLSVGSFEVPSAPYDWWRSLRQNVIRSIASILKASASYS